MHRHPSTGSCFITTAVVLDRVYLKSVRSLTHARTLLIPADAVHHCSSHRMPPCPRDCHRSGARLWRCRQGPQEPETEIWHRTARQLAARRACRVRLRRQLHTAVLRKKHDTARRRTEVLSRAFATLSAYQVHVTGSNVEIGDLEALHKLARPGITNDRRRLDLSDARYQRLGHSIPDF